MRCMPARKNILLDCLYNGVSAHSTNGKSESSRNEYAEGNSADDGLRRPYQVSATPQMGSWKDVKRAGL